MSESIEQLRVYKMSRGVEDVIYETVKTLPVEHFYGLGNDLRRSSAGVSHYLMESHRLFSYRLKLDALAAARRECEAVQKHLAAAKDLGFDQKLIDDYAAIIKQTWGLTKWIRNKLIERQEKAEVSAKEAMAAAI